MRDTYNFLQDENGDSVSWDFSKKLVYTVMSSLLLYLPKFVSYISNIIVVISIL